MTVVYIFFGISIVVSLVFLATKHDISAGKSSVATQNIDIHSLENNNIERMNQINGNKNLDQRSPLPYVYKVFPDTFVLTDLEVQSLFKQMEAELTVFNNNVPSGSSRPALPLTEYIYGITTRQIDGIHTILINGLPPRHIENPDWYKQEFDDGGQMYLDAQFNLKTREMLYFSTHGEA